MFFCFTQNNSFGYFDEDDVAQAYVIIEASSPEEANSRAVEVGLYFNGTDNGNDCSCCGDRWYPAWSDDDGDDHPSIYGTPIEDYRFDDGYNRGAWVYYADGRKQGFGIAA
jgi:hypothetical protein